MNAEALLVECEPLVRQMAHSRAKRAGRPDLERDLGQAARIGLWQQAGQAPVDAVHRIKWAATVIRTRMLDLLREELGRAESLKAQTKVVPLDDTQECWGPCEALSLITVARLLESIKALPERDRLHLEGLAAGREQQELAAEAGVSHSAMSLRQSKLRQWVLERL
jgi:RNA polymerase sigma factor (sigma-70 family)